MQVTVVAAGTVLPTQLVSPTAGATGVSTNAELAVDVAQVGTGDLDVEFYGREKADGGIRPRPLDIDAEIARYGAETPGGVGVSVGEHWPPGAPVPADQG